jgi:Ca-activated chloride channel family protein
MIFQSPAFLWLLLLPVALAAFSSTLAKRDRNRLAALVDFRLLDRLTASVSRRRRTAKHLLLLAALTLGILGLARPTWGERVTSIQTSGRDVLLAIDVSRSMLANDIAPSRLLRAKMAAEDLISLLPGDRVGLLAFAGSAFLQAPITSDHSAVKTCIQELDTEIIPLGGTNVTAAVQEAKRAFKQAEGSLHALVIISDGEDLENDVIQTLKKDGEGIRIFTLGIGTPEGTILTVPSPNGGVEYVRGPDGQIVKSALDEAKMKAIAEATGGFYQRLRSGPPEMRRVAEDGISRMEETMGQTHEQRQAIDRFEWFVSPALALLLLSLLLSERRKETSTAMTRSTSPVNRATAIVALLAAAALIPTTQAATSAGLDAYQKGDFDEAKRLFDADRETHPESPEHAYNAGTSAYQKGSFAEAVDLFGRALQSESPAFRSKASYNIGNSLVKLATSNRRSADRPALENAITQYEEALRLDPDLSQARENAEKVREFLKKLDEQKDKSKSSKDKDKNKDKQDKNKDDQSKDEKDGNEGDDKEGSPDNSDSKDGKKGDSKKSDKSGDQKENGEDKGEKSENGKDEQKSKNGPGERKEEKDGSGKDQKDADGSNQETQKQEVEKRDKGELKSEPQQGAENAQPQGEPSEQQEGEGGTGGVLRMTPQQAQALIDALRAEERRVQLLNPEQRRDGKARTFKNW